jgi:hypothetical protein
MLALVDCVNRATCAAARCEEAAGRLERCEDASESDESGDKRGGAPDSPSAPGQSEPGGSGDSPALVGAVTCLGTGVGTNHPESGVSFVTQMFSQCSDGNTYTFSCAAPAQGVGECQCLVNGTPVSASGSTSPVAVGDCGWNLRL